MVQRDELLTYLAEMLNVQAFADYAPNGLQVEGRAVIKKIITGVTASQALVDAAVAREADALLVHHGYFWTGEEARIIGMKRRRLGALMAADINLLAYHLPLDAHPELGNNTQLAKLLGLQIEGTFGSESGTHAGPAIGQYGRLAQAMSATAFGERLARKLSREALHIAGGSDDIHTLAWCTGAAQSYLERAAALGVDAFVTGEVSEQTVHVARELGLHFFSAGHHATERGGVQALGAHLATHFGLEVEFVDIDNPV